MRHIVWCLTLVGCGVATDGLEGADSAVGEREGSIVGGTLTSGDPAVVALALGNGQQFQAYCTGTLVGPKTVLTAAHCLSSRATGRASPYAVFGPRDSAPTQAVRIISQTQHAQYRATGGRAYDFGVIQLERAVTTVAPIQMNGDPLERLIGQPIRHVGYGVTSAGGSDSGTKREVTYTLRRVDPLLIESGADGKQTCQGDSGGPGFMRLTPGAPERLVGIVSFGSEDCETTGYDGRVGAVLPWIQRVMSAWESPTCAADSLCKPGCMPVDPDCACAADGRCTAECADLSRDPDCPADCATNGVCSTQACPVPDADCAAVGTGCTSELQCEARLCVTDAQNTKPYCSIGCGTTADCPNAMECLAGACRLPQRTPRALFDSCIAASDFCVASECNGPAGGITRCVATCSSSTDCPGGSTCEGGANGRRYCRPASLGFSNLVLASTASLSGPAASGCSAVGSLELAAAGLLLSFNRRRAKKA